MSAISFMLLKCSILVSYTSKVILYSFYLESGQLINDDVIYQLSEGDKLIARSNITTVVINITGSEHATNTQ